MRVLWFWLAFALVVASYAAGGDTIQYSDDVNDFADGDTFFTDIHWHPMKDSIQRVVNGRLGDVNIASDANIAQPKIDSTGTDADDWIYQYTKKWQVAGAKRQLRSGRGIGVYINDTTANGDSLVIIADSTDTVAAFYEDSVRIWKGTRISDTLECLKVSTGQGVTEVYNMNQNVRTTDDVVFDSVAATKIVTSSTAKVDSLASTKGITATTINTGQGNNEVYAQNQNLRTTDDVTFDSVKVTTGINAATINTGQGNYEVYAQNQNLRTTDDVTFDSVAVTKITISGAFTTSGTLSADSLITTEGINVKTVNTGQGNYELYWMNQDVGTTSDPTFNNINADSIGLTGTISTGHGWNELYPMDQAVQTTDTVDFAAINTGQGDNELYDMDQNVLTSSAVTFATVNTGQGDNELYDMDQNVQTTDTVTFGGVTASVISLGYEQVAITDNSIALTKSLVGVNPSADDTISVITGGAVGQIVHFYEHSGSYTVSFKDTTGLRLGDTYRVINSTDILTLIKRPAGDWAEISYSDNN